MESNTRSLCPEWIFLPSGGASEGNFNATLCKGDFLYVPAWLPHQEINPSSDVPFQWIVVRSTSEPIVVKLPDDYWGDIGLSETHLRIPG